MLRQGAGDSLLAERLPVNPVAARALAVLLGDKGDGARYTMARAPARSAVRQR